MSDIFREATLRRSAQLRSRMRRYNLVFVQCGALFDVFSDDLLASVPHRRLKASDFAGGSGDSFEDVGILLLTGVEEFARSGKAADATLGQLRVCVDKALDEGVDVCLLSRAPKIAYVVVPGSSVIEDAAFYAIPILGVRELLPGVQLEPESVLPAVGLRGCDDLRQLFTAALSELGSAVLEALDHGIFEVDHTQDFIRHLDVRVLEALRGAGFVVTIDGRVEFSVPRRFVEFREAVANALAGVAEPPADLASISEGLWFIERRIRGSLRRLAISLYGDKWRKRVLHGDLGEKVLERARVDAHVGARSVAELRDPIEWLTLGELLEVTRSSAFGGLHFDEVAWRRFTQDTVSLRSEIDCLICD